MNEHYYREGPRLGCNYEEGGWICSAEASHHIHLKPTPHFNSIPASDPIHTPAEAPTYVEAVPRTGHYSDPTRAMLDDPIWNAIWEEIKTWDVNVPSEYAGYCGATGNHATAIFLAIQPALQPTAPAEAQAVKPAPENGEYSILGYDGERQSPTSSAPSAPYGSQIPGDIWERIRDGLVRYDIQHHPCKCGRCPSDHSTSSLQPEDYGMWVPTVSAYRAVREAYAAGIAFLAAQLEAKTTENASLLAAVNRSNELDREAAEKIVAMEKQAEQARSEALEQAADSVRNVYRRLSATTWKERDGVSMALSAIRTLQNQTQQDDSARKEQP